jgi:hypothetical protein
MAAAHPILAPGTFVLVAYSDVDEDLWHERLLLAPAATPDCPSSWVVLTPDLDMYVENLGPPDIATVRPLDAARTLPFGVNRNSVYRFQLPQRRHGVPNQAEMTQLLREADTVARLHLELAGAPAADQGAGPHGPAPPPLPIAAAPPVPQVPGLVAPRLPPVPEQAPMVVFDAGRAAQAVHGQTLAENLVAPTRKVVKVWRAAEARAGLKVGDAVDLPAGTVVFGDRATLVLNGEAVHLELVAEGDDALKQFKERRTPASDLDCRILKVRRDAQGNRRREWRDVPDACSTVQFSDFPLPGERTAAWCLAHVDRHHGGMEQHHALFKTLCKLQLSDWGVELHETLAGILHTAACYDQLDLTNLAWAEMAFRSMQSIEFVYQERMVEKETLAAGSRLTLEERTAFTGAVRPGQQLMVCPSLLEHVKKEAERSGSLLKELRKAREEREARKGGKK